MALTVLYQLERNPRTRVSDEGKKVRPLVMRLDVLPARPSESLTRRCPVVLHAGMYLSA